MPTIGVLLIFNSGARISAINTSAQWYIVGLVFVFTYVLPAIVLGALHLLRLIGHLEASERNERIFPVAVTALIYYLTYSFLSSHDMLVFVALFILSVDIVLILLLIQNFFWKVSLHGAGIGGICALALFITIQISPFNAIYLALSILVAGLVAHARLSLQEHTPGQLIAGFFTGFAPVLGMFLIV
jgi:hypothetical protein